MSRLCSHQIKPYQSQTPRQLGQWCSATDSYATKASCCDGRRRTGGNTEPASAHSSVCIHRLSISRTNNPIIDIAMPPGGGLSPFNVYVALSRGHDRENIRLLRDFDEKLLTTHPSEYLC